MYVLHLLSRILTHGCSSNGGVFGSLFGTPIINLPQAAVLGEYLQTTAMEDMTG